MSEPKSKVWYLKQMNLFHAMPMSMAEKVSEMVEESKQLKGNFIYLTDEPSTTIYFLKEGRVKIFSTSEDGKEVIKAILYPGEVFGDLTLLGESQHKDFAIALDNVLMCSISKDKMTELVMMMPELGLALNAIIGKKNLKLERRFESLVFKDARTRVIEFLLTMAKEHGEKNGAGIYLKHNLTQEDISNLVATSRQTVTTLLNELREVGIIKIERRGIAIKCIGTLEAYVLNPMAIKN